MKKNEFEISVIVPIYKWNKYIKNIISMLVTNAKKISSKIELILINDYPTEKIKIEDGTNLDNLTIRNIENPNNLGIQRSRIQGIKHSKGKYVVMLDQDDVIKSDALYRQLRMLKNSRANAIISNGYSEENGSEKVLFNSKRQMKMVNDLSMYMYLGNLIASPGMCMIKKSSIPKLWMMRENTLTINGADDWLLWVLFLIDKNYFEINYDDKLYIHRTEGIENTSTDNEKMLASSMEAMEIVMRNYSDDPRIMYLLNKYNRRLQMRFNYELKKDNKILEYLKNPDIAARILRYKWVLL